jgi:hypothetical protein
MDIYFGKSFNQYFLGMSLLYGLLTTFYHAMKSITSFEMLTETLLKIPFIVIFLSVDPYWLQ